MLQCSGVLFVVGDVAVELGLPPFGAGFRGGGSLASFMAVPEAAVDEDDRVVFGKDDIGFAGEVFPVQAEAVAGAVEHGADLQLGLGILAADLRHVPRSLLWRQRIHRRSLRLRGVRC